MWIMALPYSIWCVLTHTHTNYSWRVYHPRFDTDQASKPLCRQEGVFRFNCMDCLDRTNVIQSVVAKEVIQSAVSISSFPFSIIPYLIPMPWLPSSLRPSWFPSIQLQKLGVIPFDENLGGPALTAYQEMWANNGDTISRQYTGTAAMKVRSLWIWCHNGFDDVIMVLMMSSVM